MHLPCIACSNLSYDRFFVVEEGLSRYHAVRLDEMRAAATVGCKICFILLEGIEGLWEDEHKDSVLLEIHLARPLSAYNISGDYWGIWEQGEESRVQVVFDNRSGIEFFTHEGSLTLVVAR
jgi:hypothetical protein